MPDEKNARLLDSMALAFSLCGDHREAVDTQRRAVELIGPGEPELRASLQSRLEKYVEALGSSSAESRRAGPGVG